MRRQHTKSGGVRYRVCGATLVIDLAKPYRIVSSAPRGGGIVRGRSILNHQVPANPVMPGGRSVGEWSDPARYLGRLARNVRAAMPVVGLMTAVPMTHLVVDREESGSLLLECFCTVGVTNAVRAGEPVRSRPERTPDRDQAGTINIILVTNATLTIPALIGAVQVATESKTATLIKHKVPSAYEKAALATGTGTDAVVLASSLAGNHKLQYSGTHTEMGAMIGRLVGRCVERGLRRFAGRNNAL